MNEIKKLLTKEQKEKLQKALAREYNRGYRDGLASCTCAECCAIS